MERAIRVGHERRLGPGQMQVKSCRRPPYEDSGDIRAWYCRGQWPAAVPNRTAAVRSSCSRPPATVRLKRSCAPTGFTVEQMVELVRAGLASATGERLATGGKVMEVMRVRITEAGRRALEAQYATAKRN